MAEFSFSLDTRSRRVAPRRCRQLSCTAVYARSSTACIHGPIPRMAAALAPVQSVPLEPQQEVLLFPVVVYSVCYPHVRIA